MASDFVLSFTKPLLQSKDHYTSTPAPLGPLTNLLASVDKPRLSPSEVADAAAKLQDYNELVATTEREGEDQALLKQAIVAKLAIALYADALETQITQALDMETEAQWWADVERSRANVAWYLLQTLPHRLADLFRTVVEHIHAQNPDITSLRSLSISSLASTTMAALHTLQPGVFLNTVFPQPLSVISSARVWRKRILLPHQLAQQECRYNRLALEKLRDERATTLGQLALLRGHEQNSEEFLRRLIDVLSPGSSNINTESPTFPLLQYISVNVLPSLSSTHHSHLRTQNLLRPSRLTQLWPKLLLLPPLALYAIRVSSNAAPAIAAFFQDAKETTEAFVQGWLVDPLKDVLRTIRAGFRRVPRGEVGVIVRPEGVRADMDSLERMAVSLAVDVLGYDPSDTTRIDTLRNSVRVGDLTDIMRVYEEDMRRPVSSAIRGSLVRGILLQVQKAKVDIDQALTGIDKLLKSQELTFAFVGVAPALGLTYLALGLVGRALFLDDTDRDKRRFGGVVKRGEVWADMRRIERILIKEKRRSKKEDISSNEDAELPLPPLSTGLLLLSLTRLRSYAQTHLPTTSTSNTVSGKRQGMGHAYTQLGGMRAAFLEDLSDLEDPSLGRQSKMKTVDRMWRCWADVLGWK